VTVTTPIRHRYHALPVRQVQAETDDAVSIGFDVPIDLVEAFAYRPGQFVTLKVEINGEEHLRSYSMSSVPGLDDDLRVTVKRVPGGLVSNWLNDIVSPGGVLESSPPAGAFVLVDDGHDVVVFAAGSGITPVYSILKSGLFDSTRHFRLLYANRDRDTAIFADELDELAISHADHLTVVHHFDVDKGFVDAAIVVEFLGLDEEVYVCGPTPFMDIVQAAVASQGIPVERVHVERFTPAEQPEAGPIDDIQIVVTLGRQTKTVTHRANTTILQSARAAGLRTPSSCETGTCATCMARLVEGAVEMRNNEVLTPDEVAEGWILTCQAVPVTRAVKVVYE
jgi:3-ketosteroid 9alpha-monooxygenase subunit B